MLHVIEPSTRVSTVQKARESRTVALCAVWAHRNTVTYRPEAGGSIESVGTQSSERKKVEVRR